MKRFVSVLLMVLSLLIGFQQAIIVMHFKLNQEIIKQKFCVNKDKPERHCNGTCFLKKQLQNAESSDSTTAGMYLKVDILPILLIGFEAINQMIDLGDITPGYKEIRYMEPCREIFVPPPIV